jgi:hypothetical protein
VRKLLWALLILAAASAVTVVAIPTLYIQPFKPQQPAMLAFAYALRQAAPIITAVCLPIVLLSALAIVFGGPRSVPRDARAGRAVARGLALVALVGLTSLATWFSRQNHFEWMFAPLAAVTYVPAADASKFLTGDEMVMGIEVGGLSLAYPVRQMAYHHIVNDVLGTTPVVVTY